MKKFLFGILAALALMVPFAAEKADAQVVVRVGPGYHHPYHRHYYHRHYYHHHYYHRY